MRKRSYIFCLNGKPVITKAFSKSGAYMNARLMGYDGSINEIRLYEERNMKLKLEKAYRHSYAREFGSNDKDRYLDAYNLLVKVKKENPDWNPWEKVCVCTLHIHYNGHANRYGHHWSVSGFSDDMDKIMLEEFGDSYKSYATQEEMMKDLEKIVARKIPVHYKYVNRKHVPIKYELA